MSNKHCCGVQGFSPMQGDECPGCLENAYAPVPDTPIAMQKRSIIARSHDYSAASDCALYIKDRFHHLLHARFTVELEAGNSGMWKLIYIGDLDRVKNKIDIKYTGQVVEVAKAFITGRGGLPLPTGGVVL